MDNRDSVACEECSFKMTDFENEGIRVCGAKLCPRCGVVMHMFIGIRTEADWKEIEDAQEKIRKRPENRPFIGTSDGVWKKMPGLHKEIVTGTVRVIRFLASVPDGREKAFAMRPLGKLFSDLLIIGTDNLQIEKACHYIFDWLENFGFISEEMEKEVLEGKYDKIWQLINKDLKIYLCYEPVTPEPIDCA